MANRVHHADPSSMWQAFAQSHTLLPTQLESFITYQKLLTAWAARINLTTITDLYDIIEYHFNDSLALSSCIDLKEKEALVDVGSGAGFPGIPLAIIYPHLSVTLIEVTAKKIQFLDTVITTLGLGDRVTIYDQDWRSFLRTSSENQKTVFCARASLQPEELCRIFKPGFAYHNAQLVYWAAMGWEPSARTAPFVKKQMIYYVGDRERKLVLMERELKFG